MSFCKKLCKISQKSVFKKRKICQTSRLYLPGFGTALHGVVDATEVILPLKHLDTRVTPSNSTSRHCLQRARNDSRVMDDCELTRGDDS